MPRYSGNDAYYQALMEETKEQWKRSPVRLNWRTIEADMLAKFLWQWRVVEGRSHGDIQRQVQEMWGIKRGGYFRRLRRVRRRYPIP